MKLAVITVALSVAVMLITNALVSGFKNQIERKVFDFWGHIQIAPPEFDQALEPEPIQLSPGLIDSIRHIGRIAYSQERTIPFTNWITGVKEKQTQGGIRHIQAFVQMPGIIVFDHQIEGLVLKGVGHQFDSMFLKKYLVAGSARIYADSNTRSITISQSTADRLKLSTGKDIIVHFVINGQQVPRRFHIEGIYKTGLEEYDKQFALCDISVLQGLMHWKPDQYTGYELFVEHLDDLPVINEYLYKEILPSDVYSSTIRNKFPGIFDWLALQDYNEFVIMVLMIAVCLINMATVLIIFILNRLKMIGLFKAMGMRNKAIGQIFIIQAAQIIWKGILWGNVIGLGLAWLQYHFGFIKLDETDYYLNVAPIEFSLPAILIINAGILVIVLLFLIVPSWVVARISPLKTIQFNVVIKLASRLQEERI